MARTDASRSPLSLPEAGRSSGALAELEPEGDGLQRGVQVRLTDPGCLLSSPTPHKRGNFM